MEGQWGWIGHESRKGTITEMKGEEKGNKKG
jgi:hypothetical protein